MRSKGYEIIRKSAVCGKRILGGRAIRYCAECKKVVKREKDRNSRRVAKARLDAEMAMPDFEVPADDAPVTITANGFWRGRPVAAGPSRYFC